MAIKKTPPKKPHLPLKPSAAIFFTSSWLMLIVGVILICAGGFYFITTGSLFISRNTMRLHNWSGIVAAGKEAFRNQILNKQMTTVSDAADARATLIANFLKRYHSPLTPYDYFGHKLVEIADQQNLDFRLLPAIAMQESNLCKVIPPNTYNCLGLGIHTQGTWGFNSYEENFAMAAKILKKNYIDRGLVTPTQIMSKYTPHSNGSWAFSVNRWMKEIRYDNPSLGKKGQEEADLLEFVK